MHILYFLMDMKVTFLVDRAFSKVSKKTQTPIAQNDVTDVYREYVNEAFQGFFVIQCWRIGIGGENAPVLPLNLDLVDDNLSFGDWLHFNDLKMDGRLHFIRKERTQELQNHLVDILTSLEGIVILLYVVSRFISMLIQLEKRDIVSIVESVEKEMYMKKCFAELSKHPSRVF